MSRESIYGDEPEFTVMKMVDGKETWISLAQLAAELENRKDRRGTYKKSVPSVGHVCTRSFLEHPTMMTLQTPMSG